MGAGWRAIASQQFSAERETARARSICEKPKIPDSDESLGQHMQEEAAKELCCEQRRGALLAAAGVVLPAKGNAFPIKRQEPVIGDGDAMGIAAQIAQHFLGSAKGRLGVDHPILAVQPAKELTELLGVTQRRCRSGAAKSLVSMEAL